VYQRLFQYLKTAPPPVNLKRVILARVRQIAKRRLIFRGVLALGLLGGIIWFFILMNSGLTESGFYHYLSLFLSDSDIALTYWREFSLSLIEAIPIVITTVFLALFAFFFWTIPRVARDAQLIIYEF